MVGFRSLGLGLVALALLFPTPACTEDDDYGSDGSRPPPPTWLVGEEGTMLRLTFRDVSGYELDLRSDLFAIDCRGTTDAFAVGEAGVMVRSLDAGESWVPLDVGTAARLRGVVAAEEDFIHVVGDHGFWLSRDSGDSWESIPAPEVDFTAVWSSTDGRIAVAVGDDGSIWRYVLDGALENVLPAGGPALRSVSMMHTGVSVIAVGDDGTWLRSDDGGVSFAAVELETDLDLNSVRIALDGSRAIAVGEQGVVVQRGPDGTRIVEYLEPGRDLRSMHIAADGNAIAVGDNGVILGSVDFGASWTPTESTTTRNLYGVDEVHRGAHF